MSLIDLMKEFLAQSWLGTTLTIVFFGVGTLYHLWSRRRTKLTYVYLGEHLLGGVSDSLPAEIVVQYNGLSIPRLTKTTMIIWNSGENTVHGSDIAAKDPLRLQVGNDGKILSVEILKISREVNEFKTAPGSALNESLFKFDFLDPNDGAVIEILHTSTDRKPRIKGTLKGLPKGFSNLGQFTRPKPQKKTNKGFLSTVARVMFSLPVVAVLGFICAIYGPRIPMLESQFSPSFFASVFGALGGFVGMGILNSWATRRKYPRSLHLELLEK
ncbi:hypothetical protein D3C77_328720 [compost metagenome]